MAQTGFARMAMMCVLLAAVSGSGCSGWKVTTESSNELPRYNIRSIALVPFTSITTPQARDQGGPVFSVPDSLRQYDMSQAASSNVERSSRQTVTVPDYAAEKVTQLFWKRLQSREGVHVVPLADSIKASSTDGELPKARPETVAATVAKRLKADVALIGLVSVYQERVGSRLGANPAAAVGFEVKAVAADGQVLWVGNYYERQRPLTEDVLGFVQRLGMFVTAEELAQYGVDEMLKEFPFGKGSQP
ncbi:MAG: hypothetical protein ACT4O4_07945 [Nitrospiraceae bacterium]